MVWSFVYVAFCRLLQLVVLLGRSERSKELAILRRQPRRAPFRRVDRAILAAFARALPRTAWTGLVPSGDAVSPAPGAGQPALDVSAPTAGGDRRSIVVSRGWSFD